MTDLPKNMEKRYFLSELVGSRVTLKGRTIGNLDDVVINENSKLPDVTHLHVHRPFGEPALLIPWDKVKLIAAKEVIIAIERQSDYEKEPPEGSILLRDHILDKKVLDTEDREVEVVYDIRLVLRDERLYVSEVDTSRSGLLRRMHLGFLADILFASSKGAEGEMISWAYIQPLPTLGSFRGELKLKVLKEKISEMRPVDIADVLEEMEPDQRIAIFNQLDNKSASDTLEKTDPAVQRALIASLKKERVVQLINEMTPGQAADILSVLPWGEANTILSSMNKENAVKVKSIMEKQEENILDFTTTNCLKLAPDTTVLEAQEAYPRVAKGKDVIMYLYIVDDKERLLGVIDIKELLQAEESTLLKDIMVTNLVRLKPDSTLKEASGLFARYDFRAIPVTDDREKLLGVVPYRDVMRLKHVLID